MNSIMTTPEGVHPVKSEILARLGYLDGIRGMAALYVVLFHLWQFGTFGALQAGLPRWCSFLIDWLSFGRFAVGVFIVLSGYCLMLPVLRSAHLRGGINQFFVRRARRILPPYYAALCLTLALIALMPSYFQGNFFTNCFSPEVVVSHVFLLHNLSGSTYQKIDPPMWSVATEWQIYFLFPTLLLPSWRRGGIVMLIISAVLVGEIVGHLIWSTSAQYTVLFAFGMAAATIKPVQPKVWGMLAISFLLCAIWTVIHPLPHIGAKILNQDYLVGAATACFLILLSVLPNSTSSIKVLQSYPLMILGMFSYSLYLIHFPILWFAIRALESYRLSASYIFLIMSLIVLPTTMLCAYFFHLLFERPFMAKTAPKNASQAEAAAIVFPAP